MICLDIAIPSNGAVLYTVCARGRIMIYLIRQCYIPGLSHPISLHIYLSECCGINLIMPQNMALLLPLLSQYKGDICAKSLGISLQIYTAKTEHSFSSLLISLHIALNSHRLCSFVNQWKMLLYIDLTVG